MNLKQKLDEVAMLAAEAVDITVDVEVVDAALAASYATDSAVEAVAVAYRAALVAAEVTHRAAVDAAEVDKAARAVISAWEGLI